MFIFKQNFYVRCTIACRENNNSAQEVKLQVKFPAKKHHKQPVDTDDQQFNQDKADGHFQTGNPKKIKTSRRTKAMRSALRLCSHSRGLNIYLTDKKSWIVLQVHIA